REDLHHSVREVRLVILFITDEAQENVVARREVGGEVLRHSRFETGDTADSAAWRRAFHLVEPLEEVVDGFARRELDHFYFVNLWSAVVHFQRASACFDRR